MLVQRLLFASFEWLLAPAGTAGGWIGQWSPGLGDPTFMGGATVVLYLLAAAVCLRLSRGKVVRLVAREGLLWATLALILFLLGINKQLDLQSALTEIGRLVAREQGFYAQRRELQQAFIALVAISAALGGLLLVFIARDMPRATKAAGAGMVVLFGFIAVRAASFHRVDVFIGSRWLGLRANWVLEIGGIVVTLAASAWRMASTPAPRAAGRPPRTPR